MALVCELFGHVKIGNSISAKKCWGLARVSMDDVKLNNQLGNAHYAGDHLPTSPLDGVNSQKCETSLQTDPSLTRLLTSPRSDTL